jgi:peptide/nickel transport system permease protein
MTHSAPNPRLKAGAPLPHDQQHDHHHDNAAIRISAPRAQGSIIWRRFRRHRVAIGSGIVLLLLVLAILIVPYFISSARANLAEPTTLLLPPSWEFPFGTDDVGRDILARAFYGGRISLTIGLVSAILGVLIGSVVGVLAGFYRGFLDVVLMRFTDAMLSMPSLLLLIVLGRIFGSSIWVLTLVIAGLSWMTIARIVRGNVLTLREQEYITAAKAVGVRNNRLIWRHIIPNTLAPLIVAATLGVGNAILLEAGASFLGLGVQPPTASWGSMLYRAQNVLTFAPWVAIFPGLLILITVLCINFLGDGLRDALDPRMQLK